MEKLIFNLCLPNEAFVDNWHQVDTKTIQMTSLYRTMLVKPWKKEKNENVKQLNHCKKTSLLFRHNMDIRMHSLWMVKHWACLRHELFRWYILKTLFVCCPTYNTWFKAAYRDYWTTELWHQGSYNWFHLYVEVCNMLYHC